MTFRYFIALVCGGVEVHTMSDKVRVEVLDRREFVLGAAAAAAVATLLADARLAAAQEKPPSYEEALKKLIGDGKPEEGKVSLELPEIAENGNTVPFTVSVESPMTEKDHVKAMHVLSTGNPQPSVASFHFTPEAGRATVSSRMRLAKTQDVVSVAELSDGRFLLGKRNVKVTIGGCGG
jgi:sulfur-oxidizing protein SoxY